LGGTPQCIGSWADAILDFAGTLPSSSRLTFPPIVAFDLRSADPCFFAAERQWLFPCMLPTQNILARDGPGFLFFSVPSTLPGFGGFACGVTLFPNHWQAVPFLAGFCPTVKEALFQSYGGVLDQTPVVWVSLSPLIETPAFEPNRETPFRITSLLSGGHPLPSRCVSGSTLLALNLLPSF